MFAALVLGLVQGLTEFLPVSSSGHLVLVHQLFGFGELDPAFDVFVQGGTVLSVLVYFRHLLPRLTRHDLINLMIGTLPAAILGVLLADYIDALFTSLSGVALGFALTTLLLVLSRRSLAAARPLDRRTSFKIGLAQAAAILPGLSRSGSTISTSLMLGIKPEEAFNFSFLLSIPVITGASLLGARSLVWDPTLTPAYLIGFFTATISGYCSLVVLGKIVKKGQFAGFAPYTAFLCLLSLILALS